MKREYGVECAVGEPRVNFRETITQKANFNYLHKKQVRCPFPVCLLIHPAGMHRPFVWQSGGSGQFARVIGYIEPLEEGSTDFEFENKLIGMDVSPEFVPAIE